MAYTREQKVKAVKLYIKYDLRPRAVMIELGYPSSRQSLAAWYREYLESGDVHGGYRSKYSLEQRSAAVAYYLEHGRSVSATRRALGFPNCDDVLIRWIDADAPGARKVVRRGSRSPTYDEKVDAVVALETRESSASRLAESLSTDRNALYRWRRQLLGKEAPPKMPKGDASGKRAGCLEARVAELEAQVRELELRRAILEGTIELLGKDPGADPNRLTNREKTLLVDSLRPRWRLRELLEAVSMPKSSYDYQVGALSRPDKYADVREAVEASFAASGGAYGRRRIHDDLASAGIVASERVISSIMKQAHLVARGSKRRRGYSSYKGEISNHPGNKVNRDFAAALPNFLWLTDVTQFSIPAGKVYLSPIIDCFDGMAVSWTISTSPDAEMANSMLRNALSTLRKGERPVIHSDCGCHYRWPEWIAICEEAGITRSMSKKGCSPDNSACEGFFGRMKNEMFYGRDWSGVTMEQFMEKVDGYIRWYNEVRIKRSLGGMSPLDYRRSWGLAA